MKWFLSGLLSFLLATAPVLAQSEFPVETPDVAVVFPLKPTETDNNTPGGRIRLFQAKGTVGNFNLLVGTPTAFAVPAPNDPQLGDFYNAIIRGEVKGSNGELISQRDLTVQGFKGREYLYRHAYQGKFTFSKNWIFAVSPTLYTVRFITPPGASRFFRQASEMPFFNSFRLKKEITPDGKIVAATARPDEGPKAKPFPWGRLFIALPLVLGLAWWLVLRWSRSRRQPEEEVGSEK